jgi:hypothetical protein
MSNEEDKIFQEMPKLKEFRDNISKKYGIEGADDIVKSAYRILKNTDDNDLHFLAYLLQEIEVSRQETEDEVRWINVQHFVTTVIGGVGLAIIMHTKNADYASAFYFAIICSFFLPSLVSTIIKGIKYVFKIK